MPSEDSGKREKFLRKAEREKCWGSRDAFWTCMKKNNEDVSECLDFRRGFEADCPATWVAHFDRKFQFEKFKVKLATEGYQKSDEDFAKKKKE